MTFTTLAKLYSTKCFCNTKVVGLGNFCPAKISECPNSDGNVTMLYRMAGNFHGKSEKALRINFHSFKFRDCNPVQGRGVAQMMT